MSALWAPLTGWRESVTSTARPVGPKNADRPRLRAVPQAPTRLARIPFILVVIGLFAIGMTGLLTLNTTLQEQAFAARSLNRQANELAYTQADLESQINQLSAPQELGRRASQLGLRANPYPAFLVLPSGKVVGKKVPVTGAEVPSLVIKTPAQLAAEKAAAAAKRQAAALKKVAEEKAKIAEAKRQAAEKAANDKAKADAAKKAGQKKTDPTKVDQKKNDNKLGARG